MKKEKGFKLIPVGKEESEKIKEQLKDGIPPNMFVIKGDRILTREDNP